LKHKDYKVSVTSKNSSSLRSIRSTKSQKHKILRHLYSGSYN